MEKAIGERMLDLLTGSGLSIEDCVRLTTAVLVTCLVAGLGSPVEFEEQRRLADVLMRAANGWAEEYIGRHPEQSK
jgi:hypothetical protein